ncbi:hypothetical protein PRVXH_001060 [Proteinivorax hydrogeniformans]|uniref:Uncharacterized protein n=1 Tax=Proteinivorax hydrogeniformans TaxID=1826727 RepID=A0AAU8HWC5_9FIRM
MSPQSALPHEGFGILPAGRIVIVVRSGKLEVGVIFGNHIGKPKWPEYLEVPRF